MDINFKTRLIKTKLYHTNLKTVFFVNIINSPVTMVTTKKMVNLFVAVG